MLGAGQVRSSQIILINEQCNTFVSAAEYATVLYIAKLYEATYFTINP